MSPEEVLWRGAGDGREGRAVRVLEAGLQDLLTLLVAVVMSARAGGRSVPPGLTTRFKDAACRPTLGGLKDFLLWLTSNGPVPGLPLLGEYLQEERRGGWLSRLVELRNRWQHPKEESSEAIVAQVAALLESVPDGLRRPKVELVAQGGAIWRNDTEIVQLRPFAFSAAGVLQVFSRFEPPNSLIFRGPGESVEPEFQDLWAELRVLDASLEDPTPEEFRAKAWQARPDYVGEPPWWQDRLGAAGPCALLVDPAAVDGALAAPGVSTAGAVSVDLAPSGGGEVAASLAARLGLAHPPTPGELLGLTSGDGLCVLALRCADLSSRDLAQVFYWLADLRDAGPGDGLRILVARGREQLEADQKKLWDRLPDQLDEVLRRRPGAKSGGLASFFWPAERPKRFLGLF